MLSRLLVIILAVPLLFYILLSGKVLFMLFNLVVISIALYELYNIIGRKEVVYLKTGLLLGVLLPILIYYKEDISFIFRTLRITNTTNISFDMGGYIVFCILLISILQIRNSKIKNSTNELLYTIFGLIYVALFFSYSILIREDIPNGKIILLYTFVSIWACDSFAYIFGILLGRKVFKKRLSEKISPKKSIEGFIGGIIGVFIVSFSFENMVIFLSKILKISYNFNTLSINRNIILLIFLSICISIFTVLGDLFESKIKREFGVKDSGNILLGHGGFLDRFDSALFVLPIVYYIFKYLII